MSLQEMLQGLLRSRLYRLRVAIELAGGQTHEGRVADLRYDGSRSVVLLIPPETSSPSTELLLCQIVRVRCVPGRQPGPWPEPGSGPGEAA